MTLKYSLGDIWGREVLDNKTRQLVSLGGFAAQGTMPQFTVIEDLRLPYVAPIKANLADKSRIVTNVHQGTIF